MKSGIYKIEHIESGKTYIGQSDDLERRLNAHKNWFMNPKRIINRHLYNYAKKYSIDAFTFEILQECNIDALDEREIHWYNIYKDNTFNVRLDPVTNRGIKRTDEFCAINSEIQKKKFADPNNLAKHREMIKQRSLNKEWVKNVKEGAKKRAADPEWRRKQKKAVNDPERIKQIKIKNFNTGYSKCVASYSIDNQFVDYFLNAKEASLIVGGERGNIVNCLNGRIPSAYGYKWKYLPNEEYIKLNGGEILKK